MEEKVIGIPSSQVVCVYQYSADKVLRQVITRDLYADKFFLYSVDSDFKAKKIETSSSPKKFKKDMFKEGK